MRASRLLRASRSVQSPLTCATSTRAGVVSSKHWSWMWRSGFMDDNTREAESASIARVVAEWSSNKDPSGVRSGAQALALVPMCGCSLDVIKLARSGMNVIAVEIAADGISQATMSWSNHWSGSTWNIHNGSSRQQLLLPPPEEKGAGAVLLFQDDIFELLPPIGNISDCVPAATDVSSSWWEARASETFPQQSPGPSADHDKHTPYAMPAGSIDVIWDRGALTSVAPDLRTTYMQMLSNALAGGGHLFVETLSKRDGPEDGDGESAGGDGIEGSEVLQLFCDATGSRGSMGALEEEFVDGMGSGGGRVMRHLMHGRITQ